MKIKEFKIKKNPLESWSKVFQNPRDVRVESFKTGTVNIGRRGTINTKHHEAGYIKDEVLKVPIMSHWVHHKELGDFLLDVGLDKMYADDPYGGVTGESADEFFQMKNENVKFHLDIISPLCPTVSQCLLDFLAVTRRNRIVQNVDKSLQDAAKIAKLYYYGDLTTQQIAKELHIELVVFHDKDGLRLRIHNRNLRSTHELPRTTWLHVTTRLEHFRVAAYRGMILASGDKALELMVQGITVMEV